MPDSLPVWAAPAAVPVVVAFVAGMAYADRRTTRHQRAAESAADERERLLTETWGY